MKKVIFSLLAIFFWLNPASGQQPADIQLLPPDMSRGLPVMEALAARKSVRQYQQRDLSLQDLSDLLWAANGINRPQESKRTAPTAVNAQEIDIYVAMASGVYYYDAQQNNLRHIIAEDIRGEIAHRQDFAATAPVCLLIVADLSRTRDGVTPSTQNYGAVDSGIVSQNISIFCASRELGTVPRGIMDKEAISRKLGFSDQQIIFLNHPVGYIVAE